ncbi:MAG: hypothetical protein PHV63_02235 [Candidatus Daviesbacteria bacterium]|nr:hypothetical protein [Candidatus Daviesbacteria bacterium]
MELDYLFVDEVYREQLASIEDEIIIKKSVKSEAKLQEIDIEVVVTFMKGLLGNITSAWVEGTLEQRKALSGSIFPKNVTYTYPGFRTEDLGLPFKLIKRIEQGHTSLGVVYGSRTR